MAKPMQLSAAREHTVWERMTLTVDSGASDTVIPPGMLSWLELRHTHRVGQEYEVANGEIVHNMGEKRCLMKMSANDTAELEISFQVVEGIHKPLLAVSSMTKNGHEVIFSEKNPRIVLSSGGIIPMKFTQGTYEIEILVQRPGFTRPSHP